MKGIFKRHPLLPKYVYKYLRPWLGTPIHEPDPRKWTALEILIKEIAARLRLLIGQRSVLKLQINYASFQKDKCEIYFPVFLITSNQELIGQISRMYHSLHWGI